MLISTLQYSCRHIPTDNGNVHDSLLGSHLVFTNNLDDERMLNGEGFLKSDTSRRGSRELSLRLTVGGGVVEVCLVENSTVPYVAARLVHLESTLALQH